jgi:ribonucleoside-diphosphate reductase alpha chain
MGNPFGGPAPEAEKCVMATTGEHSEEISQHIWKTRYRYREGSRLRDRTIEDTWRRVAVALAQAEPDDRDGWANRFAEILRDFHFLPGGRIQAGAGTTRNVTLFNCFVMGAIEDSMEGIFRALKEGAMTMHQGGGVGYDFSTLRPAGTRARGVGAIASGPVSFMDVWDAMCATILSTGARRGAMMATMRCDHPDIERFITAKQQPGRLRHFNLSVQVTDAFMDAVRRDVDWPLVFPAVAFEAEGDTVMRDWPGAASAVPCRVVRQIGARALWRKLIRASYDYAEPGVLFIDRINRLNNLWYCERISATNPCGEIPLPPYGACDLGAINLTRFVGAPFGPAAHLDLAALERVAGIAVRLLDNVIDVSQFPLSMQHECALRSRRIGLGITGLADALIMMGLRYGSEASFAVAGAAMRTICHAAYRNSIALAREKGAFPCFDRDRYLEAPFIGALPPDIRDGIARHGIRNSHLLAIAPTGTISLLAGNVSSGVEPVFAGRYRRTVLGEDGCPVAFDLMDYALRLWREQGQGEDEMPKALVTTAELPIEAHLGMQAALQPFIDNSISKTINVPEACSLEAFERIYDLAYDKGLKGCTTFRPNPVTGAVLTSADKGADAPHCCVLERETD